MEDPAILSQDGTQVWPLSWLGLSYETLSDAIPFLTPQVRFGLQLAISGIPALPVEAVTLQSPIPCPAQDVVCLGINYMAHSDEAEKYSADAFSTQHQDAIYFSKRVSRAVPDGGFIEAHTDLVQKLDYECELAVFAGLEPARLYPRVLPTPEGIAACEAANVPHRNIIAMQGPFSLALNKALITQFQIRYLVTKDGGAAGGFAEKVQAAADTGAQLVVLRRPPETGETEIQILAYCKEILQWSH